MITIKFETKLFSINSSTILRLPKSASEKLPSRGQLMVEGTINGIQFQTPLEPDGNWSHWFRLDKNLLNKINAKAGDKVSLNITTRKNWPEPEIPDDLRKAIESAPKAKELWKIITPMARWEWLRWIRSTKNPETRKRRIEVACSKLSSGERRPCCWNRNLCTDPDVSKNGILLNPLETSTL